MLWPAGTIPAISISEVSPTLLPYTAEPIKISEMVSEEAPFNGLKIVTIISLPVGVRVCSGLKPVTHSY